METALTLTDSPSWVKNFNLVILKTSYVNDYMCFGEEGEVWLDGYQRLATSPGRRGGGAYTDVRMWGVGGNGLIGRRKDHRANQ